MGSVEEFTCNQILKLWAEGGGGGEEEEADFLSPLMICAVFFSLQIRETFKSLSYSHTAEETSQTYCSFI